MYELTTANVRIPKFVTIENSYVKVIFTFFITFIAKVDIGCFINKET